MTPTFLYHAAPCSRVALWTAKAAAHLRHLSSGTPRVLHIAVMLCLMANVLPAETFGKFTYTDNGTEITITDYPTAEVGEVEIPSSINGKPVTSIGGSAFSSCSSLTSVTIPSGVTSIGDYVFSSCSSLTNVTIPSGVTSIGNYVFFYCSGLTSAAIGSSVQAIGTSAFEGCSSLTSITIPVSVNWISDFAFRNCNSLSRILFAGDAPFGGTGVFSYSYQATVFYLPGTSDWKSSYANRPTALWLPPIITNQPASVIVNPSESATFSVTASAIAALPNSYQWQKNGIAIPGAVNSSLSLTGIQSGNVGNYTVVISNHAGSSVSAAATLTIATGNLYTQAQYDAALQMGFDLGLQVNDSDVLASPNTYDLYRLDQIQEIHVGTPLLEKDPVTGSFKMTIKAQKSTALSNFAPFPFTAGDVSINPEGNLEFQFTPTEDAAFFRLGVE
jgi:hypothetical protein